MPAGINIDQLTDQQLQQFIQANNLSGLSESEMETKARERGLSYDQIQKLKYRIQSLNVSNNPQNLDGKQLNDSKRKTVSYLLPKPAPDSINGLVIFGSEIFTKENLTFEPNINMPTPHNYII